ITLTNNNPSCLQIQRQWPANLPEAHNSDRLVIRFLCEALLKTVASPIVTHPTDQRPPPWHPGTLHVTTIQARSSVASNLKYRRRLS
ncbi:MAG: hypothetical protein ACO3FE_14990, partial [Planctomycetaceae bacterium]